LTAALCRCNSSQFHADGWPVARGIDRIVPMEDRYRLVFRAELLDGQHRAVVKKKLGTLLKIDGARLDQLFAGDDVIVRREADTATAARFQAAFKQAGARLRVLPVAAESTQDPKPLATDRAATSAPRVAGGLKAKLVEAEKVAQAAKLAEAEAAAKANPAPPSAAERPSFTLRPRNSPLLDATERSEPRTVVIDVSHLSLAPLGPWIPPPRADGDAPPPDTSHLSIAELGVDLGEIKIPITSLEVTLEVNWTIAARGTDLAPRKAPSAPAIDVDRVHFEVAPRGADLGQIKQPAPPAPPDTSHLRLG